MSEHETIFAWIPGYPELLTPERRKVDEHAQTCNECAAALQRQHRLRSQLAHAPRLYADPAAAEAVRAAIRQRALPRRASAGARRSRWLTTAAPVGAVALAVVLLSIAVVWQGWLPSQGSTANRPFGSAIPTPHSSLIGSFVWQTDGAYGYQMLRPAGWEAAEAGDLRKFGTPGSAQSADAVGIAISNLQARAGLAQGSGGTPSIILSLFEKAPTFEGWMAGIEQATAEAGAQPKVVRSIISARIYVTLDAPGGLSPMLMLSAYKVDAGQPLAITLLASGEHASLDRLEAEGILDDLVTMVESARAIPLDPRNVMPALAAQSTVGLMSAPQVATRVVTVIPEALPPILLPDVSVEQVQLPSGEAVRFLRQVGETDARAGAGGTVTGELVVADGCLRLALANGEQRLAVLPRGYRMVLQGATPQIVQIMNEGGRVVGQVGGWVAVRGLGVFPGAGSAAVPAEVLGCRGPYQIIAGAELVGSASTASSLPTPRASTVGDFVLQIDGSYQILRPLGWERVEAGRVTGFALPGSAQGVDRLVLTITNLRAAAAQASGQSSASSVALSLFEKNPTLEGWTAAIEQNMVESGSQPKVVRSLPTARMYLLLNPPAVKAPGDASPLLALTTYKVDNGQPLVITLQAKGAYASLDRLEQDGLVDALVTMVESARAIPADTQNVAPPLNVQATPTAPHPALMPIATSAPQPAATATPAVHPIASSSPIQPIVATATLPLAATPDRAALAWPVHGQLVQPFTEEHPGIDLEGRLGQPVVAAADGKVEYAGWEDANHAGKGYGYMVFIDHGEGTVTFYSHLADGSATVAVGDSVKQGQQIAEVGSTGNATRPLLHFEVRQDNTSHDPLLSLTSEAAP